MLADPTSVLLQKLTARWTARLRSAHGDEMTDDDLLAALQGVSRPAAPGIDDQALRGSPWARMQIEVHLPPDLIHGHFTMQTTTGATSMVSSHRPTLAGE